MERGDRPMAAARGAENVAFLGRHSTVLFFGSHLHIRSSDVSTVALMPWVSHDGQSCTDQLVMVKTSQLMTDRQRSFDTSAEAFV